ncbi:GMC family oxidoreductase [Paraburkholderia tropica]|uniref:GMC family oxidoreductase n=1 Tax=Paraburkholderia tropica TaxID=92647 RepID=UPI002AB30C11|nr:GMC family oxidoreductase N-terminal domain-containing protein [Paraburkholderia tropica]
MKTAATSTDSTFDYIVVGAGAAGCVVAARLSEDPRNRVLLIEAGGEDRSFWLKIPVGYGKTIADPRVNWCYETEPLPALGGRKIFWPRGKVLGGSSSINGLMYVRGNRHDYDRWQDLGNDGWSYEDVLPYFRKAEDQENGPDRFHGVGGPLHVSNLVERNPLCNALIDSAVAAGISANGDFNGAQQEGAGYYQATIKRGARVSAAVAYLHPAMKRPNLSVVTCALAHRVTIEQRRATGVVYERGGEMVTARACREVILCGGTVNSPHLLMLSGIGPAEVLRSRGIAPVHDLPGVGENLQDHYGGQITWRCRQPITMNDVMASRWRMLAAGARWLLRRDGPFSVPAGQAGLFARVGPPPGELGADPHPGPDMQFLFQTFSGGYYEDGLYKFSGFANFICPVRPRSRGTISLNSPDPRRPPALRPGYFSDEHDRWLLIGGLRLARRIASLEPLAGLISSEHLPGINVESDAEVEQYFRSYGGCVSHQVGTCKMGRDALAVVDSSLRVRGIDGLCVADASIMPTLISGNTYAASVMIGERASDFVAARAQVRSAA